MNQPTSASPQPPVPPVQPQLLPPPALVLTLGDFLKSVGWVGSGGQAKRLIQAGEVSVNGQPETRRRRKLAVGDRVQWSDQAAVVAEVAGQ